MPTVRRQPWEMDSPLHYPEWVPAFSLKATVDVDRLSEDERDFRTGVVTRRNLGRTRVVIEGDTLLVTRLLGKNWLRRCDKILREVNDAYDSPAR